MITQVNGATASEYAEQVNSYGKQIDELEAKQPLDAVDQTALGTARLAFDISVEGFIAATRRESRAKA